MQDSFLLGLAGEGSHDSPEDTELMVTLVWVCGYLCGGKEGFMHLRRFIGVPPPSSSGSPETHRKRRILKSHLVPQTAAIYHHCSPYSVHKDSAVPLWATHFNVCVCVTVHIKMLAYHWLLSWLWYLVKEGEGCCELYLACWYQKKFKRTERHRLLSEHQCTIVTYRHKRLKLKQNFFLFLFEDRDHYQFDYFWIQNTSEASWSFRKNHKDEKMKYLPFKIFQLDNLMLFIIKK